MGRIREVKLSTALCLVSGHTEIWASAWVTRKRHCNGRASGEGLGPEGLCVWGLLNGRVPGFKVLFTDCSYHPQSASGVGLTQSGQLRAFFPSVLRRSGHRGGLMGG